MRYWRASKLRRFVVPSFNRALFSSCDANNVCTCEATLRLVVDYLLSDWVGDGQMKIGANAVASYESSSAEIYRVEVPLLYGSNTRSSNELPAKEEIFACM